MIMNINYEIEPIDLLITGGIIITMDYQHRIIDDGAVAIHGGKIIALGDSNLLRKKFNPAQLIDAEGKYVIPGLINTHVHGGDVLFRGLVEDLPLESWLQELMKAEKEFVTSDSVYWGALLSYVEMIKGGITTAVDMFWHPESMVKAARNLGFRLITGPVFFDQEIDDQYIMNDYLASAETFLQNYSDDSLITPCLQPHSVYGVSPSLLSSIGELYHKWNCLLAIHASETINEVQNCINQYGYTPIWYLDSLGLLSPRTILAHCVHLEKEDISILTERGVIVSHCPISNLKLASGIADINKMLRVGVKVTLGTDGPVSGNDLNPWFTMRLTAILQKTLLTDTSVLGARQVLSMMTKQAADSLQIRHQIGSLEVGKCADIVIINNEDVHSIPSYDPYSTLIYCIGREDVCTVIINGCIVVQERKFLAIDVNEIKQKIKMLSKKIKVFV